MTSARPMTPALTWGKSPVSLMTVPAASATYSRVDPYPSCFSSWRASAYSSSGLSPMQHAHLKAHRQEKCYSA